MRTTIDIADELYGQLRTRAVERGTSVKALIHDAVRTALGRNEAREVADKADFPMIRSQHPGTVLLTSDMIHEDEMDGFR